MGSSKFPSDSKERAKRILDGCGGRSVGAYSDSAGVDLIRRDVAEYIRNRDGYTSNHEDIFLSTGATAAVKVIMKLLMTGKDGNETAGVMIPVPQYPLYTATIAEYNAFPVYQKNVYDPGSEFHSFKKVLSEMGPDYQDQELASFMSTSKGYIGECGFRGGYTEVINLDPEVNYHLLKYVSTQICPSVIGQACMDTVMNPPSPGEPSYDLFKQEKESVLGQLAEKAKMVTETFRRRLIR